MASIWLLRGNAAALMVRDCDGAATTAFCSTGTTIFSPGKRAVYGYASGNAVSDPVQRSLKSDRAPPGRARRQEKESEEDQ
jgi:hypothetical protein